MMTSESRQDFLHHSQWDHELTWSSDTVVHPVPDDINAVLVVVAASGFNEKLSYSGDIGVATVTIVTGPLYEDFELRRLM
jgi:hypothetical protein